MIFSRAIALRMIDYFSQALPAAVPQAFPELSEREREREREILDLIAQGHKNAEIANRNRLVLGERTVRNRVSNIMSKL